MTSSPNRTTHLMQSKLASRLLMAALLLFLGAGIGSAQAVLQIVPGSVYTLAAGSGTCPPSLARKGHLRPAFRGGHITAHFEGDGCESDLYANLKDVTDVASDTAGNIYIVDHTNNVVREVNHAGTISTFAGGGGSCPSPTDAIGDGCPANTATLNGPNGITFDSSGNAYITEAGFPGSATPRVRKVTPEGIISLFAGTGVPGYSGDDGPALSATFEQPTAITADASNNVYIADPGANAVREVDSEGYIITIAGAGPGCAEQTDSLGDGCPGNYATLLAPNGVVSDPAGNLYIADTGDNLIRKLIASSGIITAFAGTGTQGFSGDGGLATAAEFNSPQRLFLDPTGALYIADSANDRIRKIDPSRNISTIAGGGSGCTFSACSALESQLGDGTGSPTSVTLDTFGGIYIGSGDEVLGGGPQGALAIPATALGATSTTQTLVLSNIGTETSDTLPASLTGYTATGNTSDFSLTGGTCITTNVLAPGASCTLQAIFTPTAIGERSVTYTFTDTSANSPESITIYGFTTPPPPTITTISPAEIAAGTNGFTLTVNGTNFDPYTVVLANDTTLTTTYVSPTQLTAVVPAALLATPTTISLDVINSDDLASNTVSLSVVPDVLLSSITPTLAIAQTGSVTITATGGNFTAATVLQFNGTALATTVSGTTKLSAVVPATALASAETAQITAYDAASGSQSAPLPFTVLPSPSVVFSGPSTSAPATQPGLTFQLSKPYPIAIAGTMTLAFVPAQGEPDDPAIQFATGGRTFSFTLPANTTTTPAIQLQSGTVAGTITVTLDLTASGVDVTPSSIAPVAIAVPKAVPVITNLSIVRSGTSVTVYVTGYSTSRDMANAYFDFTPAPGSKFSTTTFTIPVSTPFSTWFASAPSDAYGSAFTYFQTFTLSDGPGNVQSVSVTLENSQGKSQSGTAQ